MLTNQEVWDLIPEGLQENIILPSGNVDLQRLLEALTVVAADPDNVFTCPRCHVKRIRGFLYDRHIANGKRPE